MVDFTQKTRKKEWYRLVTDDYKPNSLLPSSQNVKVVGDSTYLVLSQKDLMAEFTPTAHPVMSSKYRPPRPIIDIGDDDVERVVGFADVARVTVGDEIVGSRAITAHVFGNDIVLRNEGDAANGERLKLKYASWAMTGMKDYISTWGHSGFSIGDMAVVITPDTNIGRPRVQVFSFLKNDKIYQPSPDEFIRITMIDGIEVLEYFTNKSTSQWVKAISSTYSATMADVWNNFIKWIKNPLPSREEKSSDGWRKISEVPHRYGVLPVIYFKAQDTFCGVGTDLRMIRETVLSDWQDSNDLTSKPWLVLNGEIVDLPPLDSPVKVIAGKGKDFKAEIMTPPDASTALTLFLKENKDAWEQRIGIVTIDPEQLKGGNATGAYIRNLYTRSLQTSTNIISEMRPVLSSIIELFFRMDDLSTGGRGFVSEEIKYSWSLTPFVPKNDLEYVSMISMQVAAGITSKQTGSELMPNNSPFEWSLLQEEAKAATEKTETEMKEGINTETENVVITEEEKEVRDTTDNNLK